VVALGTIESTRLALLSFGDIPNANLLGRNLMAHLRSNVAIRVPRSSLPGQLPQELMASALFVKEGIGTRTILLGISISRSRLRDSATWEPTPRPSCSRNFPISIPLTPSELPTTSRGHHHSRIGEMQPDNPANQVRLDPEIDEFGQPRSFVSLPDPTQSATPQSQKDVALWDAMDSASDEVAKIFANGADFEIFTGSARSESMPTMIFAPYFLTRRDEEME